MARNPISDKAKRRRAVLLDAARTCLLQDGFFAFSTNRVAQIADVSIGSLYQYFDTKEAVLHTLIAEAHETALEALEAVETDHDDPVAALCDLALADAAARADPPGLARHLTYFEATLQDDAHARLLRDRCLAYLVEVLAEHRAPAPEAIAAEIQALTRALAGTGADTTALRGAVAGYLAVHGVGAD